MFSRLALMDGFICLFSRLRPVWLRRFLFSFFLHVGLVLFRLKFILHQLCLPVALVSGVDKYTKKEIRLLLVGSTRFPLFLNDRVFVDDPVCKPLGSIFIFQLKKVCEKFGCDVDGVLVSCDRFYQRWLKKSSLIMFPDMVTMVLDTSKGVDEMIDELSRSARIDMKKVKKNGFTFEITSDVKKLKMFYVDMYMPTLKKRFDKESSLIPDFVILRYFRELGYELMLTSYQGKEVSGVLFYQQGDELLMKYTGVLNGDFSLIQQGALASFYYFSMLLAQDRGITRIDFESVRPFFDDGLFQYKKKWGTQVRRYDLVPKIHGFFVSEDSNPMKQFLLHNPFVGIDDHGEFVGFMFYEKGKIDEDEKIRFEEMVLSLGISEVCFIEV